MRVGTGWPLRNDRYIEVRRCWPSNTRVLAWARAAAARRRTAGLERHATGLQGTSRRRWGTTGQARDQRADVVVIPDPAALEVGQLNLPAAMPSRTSFSAGSAVRKLMVSARPSRLFGLGRPQVARSAGAEAPARAARQRCRSRPGTGQREWRRHTGTCRTTWAGSGQLVDAHEEDGLELQPLDVLNIEDPDVALLPDGLAFAAGDHLNVLVGERLVQRVWPPVRLRLPS